MKNKLLLPLVALLALAFLVLWKVASSTSGSSWEGSNEIDLGTPQARNLDVAGGAELPELVVASGEELEREEVASEGSAAGVVSSSREASISNAVWVEGRVLFPDRMPNDMGEVRVTAKGRRFEGTGDGGREHTALVDRDGRFRVAFARATKRGWLDVSGRYLYLPEKQKIELRELPDELLIEPEMGGVISGVLSVPRGLQWTDATREGAHVAVNAWFDGSRYGDTAAVDSDGRYELQGIPPGSSYTLAARVPRWIDQVEHGVSVRAGESIEVNYELEVGSSIMGQVVGQDMVGLAGVLVEMSGSATDDAWMRDQVQTDESGNFQFHGLRDAEIELKAVVVDHLPVEVELGHVIQGTERTGVILKVDEGLSIAGVVEWPDGRPAAGAFITATPVRKRQGMSFSLWNEAGSEKAQADGSFRITGLKPEAYVVRAWGKSFRKKELDKAKERAEEGRDYILRARGPVYKVRTADVHPGSGELLLVLQEGDRLSGRVLDDVGEGLTNFVIEAKPVSGSELGRQDAVSRIIVSLDGSFTIDGLQEGSWTVTARAKSHQSSESQTVSIPGSVELELVTKRSSELRGTVLSPAGEPVSGAKVWVDSLGKDEAFVLEGVASRWGEETTTNQKGAFTIRDQRPGRSRVHADAPGFGSSHGVELQLVPGNKLEGVSLRLRQASRILGSLHAVVGELDGREISLRVEGRGSFYLTTTTDSRGGFEFIDLDAGTYRLVLQEEDDDPVPSDLHRTIATVVDVKAGADASVVLGAPPASPTYASGQVTSGGQPLAGILITCRASKNGDLDNDAVRSDSNGEFLLTLSGAGGYKFKIGNPETGQAAHYRELQQGQNSGIDFDLPISRISGVVTASTGGPRASCTVALAKTGEEHHSEFSREYKSVETNDQGYYEFEFVDAGEYLVTVNQNASHWGNRNEFGIQYHEGLVIGEGAYLEGLNFQLEPEGIINIRIVGSDGQPAQGARVSFKSPSGISLSPQTRMTVNSSGSRKFGNLGAGTYFVHASKGQSSSERVKVKVQSGETQELELILRD